MSKPQRRESFAALVAPRKLRDYAPTIFLVVSILGGVVALVLSILAALDGALDLYSVFGWRGFESLTIFLLCLTSLTVTYLLLKQSHQRKSTNPSRKVINETTARRRSLREPLVWISVIAIIVPAVDVGVQTKFSVASILKSKSTEEAEQKELPTASKLDVAGQTLGNTDFSNEDLGKSKASGATLVNINFSGANLNESDFRSATFSEKVELTGASLCGTDFRGADLTGAVGLNAAHMRFTIANSATRFPPDIEKTFLNGLVIDDLDRDRLYQCQDGESKMLRADGTRT